MTVTNLPRRRLPARYAVLLMPLILSVMMTFVVSLIATVRGIGLSPEFTSIWLGSWLISWIVAFPTLLVVLPLVRRIVAMLVEPPARL